MTKAGMICIGRPDPDRLKYAMWQFYCAVYCDRQEKFGITREQASERYRKLNPPPPRPWLAVEGQG